MSPETQARYGLPLDVRFCAKCVISNQRPSSTREFLSTAADKKSTIGFDESGVCDACNYNDVKNTNIDWYAREQDLIRLAENAPKSGGYDVVVPGSGGKDSAYTAHILKYKYGMNPLTVTWAPHLYTDIGWKNFQNWMHVGGLDNILFTPNGRLHRHLTKLAFENLLHPFQPFIVGQRIIGPLIAKKFGIPLVMYGENQAEYGNSSSENYTPTMDKSFFSKKSFDDIRLGGSSIKEIVAETDFSIDDFSPYIAPDASELEAANVEVHYLGYYLKWDPQECFYYAAENTGFTPNSERTQGSYSKYSSIDDKIDPFHYYTTLAKFGLGRASYDAAQEIRTGKITRAEGVSLVEKFDQEFPSGFFPEFLDYVSSTEERFHETVDRFRSPHLWDKRSGKWELQHSVWG
jgi:N-acetyl sugar amidotransferase